MKQEFRQHLDKASEEQMNQFIQSWEVYHKQLGYMDTSNSTKLKDSLKNDEFDSLLSEKTTQGNHFFISCIEQKTSMQEFKDLIYESEQKKKK